MEAMILSRAVESEYAAIVTLANRAYRASGASASWNSESGFITGDRLTEALLRQDLAAKPDAYLLVCREAAPGPVVGTVWLEPRDGGVWYLGLLTVDPAIQNRQLGRRLLAEAERFASERGAKAIQMRVVQVRETLIAWYERRGYVRTGETEPFPYGDQRFGRPLRGDLCFVVLAKTLESAAGALVEGPLLG